MPERIVRILESFRRRLLAVRAAEAAASGTVVGALCAAVLLAGRVLAGRYPSAAAGLCVLPLLAAAVLALWPPARSALGGVRGLGWLTTALLAGIGLAAVVAVALGVLPQVPRFALVGLVGLGAGLSAGFVLARGADLRQVAIGLDRRAGLAERLSTAWELHVRGERTAFARAVQLQVAEPEVQRRVGEVRFWNRTPAALGAVGLALLAVAAMLPWEPMVSPADVLARQWRQVGPQAGQVLQEELQAVRELPAAKGAELSAQLRRLEALVKLLRRARPEDARRWQGRVLELEEVARALRRALGAGGVDARTRRRIERLLHAIDQAAGDLAAAMGGAGPTGPGSPGGGMEPGKVQPASPAQAAPPGYASVYHPQYPELVKPGTTAPAHGVGTGLTAAPPGPRRPLQTEWSAARARAARALRAGEVPAKYRQLIRDFFAAEGG